MPGQQGAQGAPAMIPFWQVGQGTQNAGYAMLPSEGLATTQLQTDTQKQLQAAQNAYSLQSQQLSQGFQGQQGDLARAQQQSLAQQQIQQANTAQQSSQAFQSGQGEAQRQNDLSIAQMPWDFKNKVFGTFSPLLQGLFGQVGGMLGGASGSGTGGAPPPASSPGPQPTITAGPVWNPQQIQQQVNAGQAQNAATANAQQQTNQKKLAGQGFGSNSPLLAGLNQAAANNLMAQNATTARQVPWNAAQGNATQLLNSQQAQEGQWQDYQQSDIARRQQALTAQGQQLNFGSSLVAALAGMV